MDIWYELKLFGQHLTGLDMNELHIVLGVVLQFAAAFLLRMPVSRIWPWLIVLGLELLNEAYDLAVEKWPHPGMQFGEGARDILLTMFLPTLILIAARYYPGLFAPAEPEPDAP